MMSFTRSIALSLAALACTFLARWGWTAPGDRDAAAEPSLTATIAMQQAHFDALPDVLATYDGGELTKQELSATLQLRKPRGVAMMAPADIMAMPPERLRQVAADIVFERLLMQKALEEGIDKSTSGIRERLENYEDEVFNRLYYERIFEPELRASRERMAREAYERDKDTKYTVPGKTLMAEIYFSSYKPYEVKPGDTIERIAEQQSGDRKKASRILRDDAFHYYRRSPGVESGSVDFVEVKPGEKLLVPLRVDEMTSKESLARRVYQELARGGDFMELARRNSDAPRAKRDEIFELDPLMSETVRKIVERTPVSSTTQILRTAHGLHILKVVERTETRTLTFDEVRDKITLDPEALRKAEELARKNLVERLRSKYHLELNLEALARDDYQGTNPLTGSTWIARSGNFVYTLDDFRKELLPFQKSWQGLSQQERIDFVKSSPKILKHLVKLEAKSVGLEKDPQYRAEMDSRAVIDITTQYLRQLEAKLPQPSEVELREWYDKHIDQFTGNPQVKMREITKRVNPLLPEPERSRLLEAAKNKLQEIRQRIRSVRDFEEQARRESDAIASRSRGGLVGVVPLGFRGEEFKAQIAKLEAGQVSEPFLYGSDMTIVMIEEKIAAPVMPFERAKPRVQQILLEERRKKMRDDLRERLFAEKHVQFKI